MKRFLLILAVVAVVFAVSGALWWHEINMLPAYSPPKPPPLPSPNAYDYFAAALKLDVDSDKALAAADRPPGYKDPDLPEDRYYTLSEKKALLTEYQPLLAKVRQGLPYPYAVPDPYADFFATSADKSLPPQFDIRELARMVGFVGVAYADEGDWSDAARCDLDAIQLGERETHGLGDWPNLDGLSCERIGFVHLWKTVDHLNRSQIDVVMERLQQIDADKLPIDHAMAHSQMSDQMGLLRLFRRPHWRIGISVAGKKFLPPLAVYFWSDRTIMQNELSFDSAWVREVKKPFAQRWPLPAVPNDALHQWENSETVTYAPPKYGGELNHTRTRIWFKGVFTQVQTNLILTALALRAYKLDHGAYPASLAQLAPAYLKSLPADPFATSGSLLGYRAAGESYVLYSIGPDAKDDAGQAIESMKDPAGYTVPTRMRRIVYLESKGDIVAGVNTED